MTTPADRPRHLKLYLSHAEWEQLVHITDADDCCAADALGGFIHQRYQELCDSVFEDPVAAADALVELARKLRSLARRRRLAQ